MATVTIVFDGTRVNASDTNTNWGNFNSGGGTPASENQNAYQGTAVNKKVTSTGSRVGIDYDPGASSRNMWLPADRLYFVKGVIADAFDLNASFGTAIGIGSGNAAYYEYCMSGTSANRSVYDAYPPQGGYLITAIDPRIVAWRESTTGTPDLTAVDYWHWSAQFITGAAKNENLALDAIDVGRGLILHGGDGADPDGAWQDFIDADQGTDSPTAPGRVGVVTSPGPGLLIAHGLLQIGRSTEATVFDDSTTVVVFPDGYHSAGSIGKVYNIENASTTITDGGTTFGQGSNTTHDTRPDYRVVGTSGTATLDGATITDYRRLFYNNATTATGQTITTSGQIDPTNEDYSGLMVFDGTGDYIRKQSDAQHSHTFANGDFTLVAWCASDDWTPSSISTVFYWGFGTGLISLRLELAGTLRLDVTATAGGTDQLSSNNFSTAGPRLPDGEGCWVKVEYDASTGDADFFYSLEKVNAAPQDIVWVAHGTPTGTGRVITTITEEIYIGANSGVADWTGDIAYVSLWDGIGTGTANDQVILADWRWGPDFTGSPGTRADGVANLTWEEQGNPVYTQGDDNTTAADFDGAAIDSSTSYAAMRWDVNADPNGELDNTEWTSASNHAIEFGKNTPSTITLTNPTFNGYSASNDQNSSTFYNNSGKAITINVTGGTGNTTYRNGLGSTTTVQSTVTLNVNNVIPGSTIAIVAQAGGPETPGDVLFSKPAIPSSFGYVELPGTNEYVETTINPDLSATDEDYEIIAYIRADDWTPGAERVIVSQWATGGNRAFRFYINASNQLALQATNGIDVSTHSGNTTGFTDATYGWVRVVYDYDGGGGGNARASFYTSTDGEDTHPESVTWTAAGTSDQTQRAKPFPLTPVRIGADSSGSYWDGRVAYVQMWNEGNATTGTPAFEADWRTGPDFDANDDRPDDIFDGLTWSLAGTSPTYTTAATANLNETFSYNYQGDQDVLVRVRKSSHAAKYLPVSREEQITNTGLSVRIAQSLDPNIAT